MILRITAILLGTGFVVGPVLLAQPVFHDSQSPQVAFAAAEIDRALGSKRAASAHPIRDLSSDASSLRFAIAADPAESKVLAQKLRIAPLKTIAPQSYAIRRVGTAGRVTTIAVLGADPTGAMYGALDVAEALGSARSPTSRIPIIPPHRAARYQIQYTLPSRRASTNRSIWDA